MDEDQGGEYYDTKAFMRHLSLLVSLSFSFVTYQTKNNEENLNDICVCDRYEASKECVTESNDGGHDDGDLLVDVEDDLEGGSQSSEDGSTPEDLGHCSWQGLQSSPFTVFLSERVDHRHIFGISHWFGKKCSACNKSYDLEHAKQIARNTKVATGIDGNHCLLFL